MKTTFEMVRKIFDKNFLTGPQFTVYDTLSDSLSGVALPTDATGAAVPSLGHSTLGSTGRLFPLHARLNIPSAPKAYSAIIIPLYPITPVTIE